MPVIIALMLRRLVMATVSGAVATIAQETLDGTFKALVYEIKDKEGITEQDAWDIVRKILGDLLIQTGVSYASLGLKLPVKTAEMLGLTNKGFASKALGAKAAQVSAKLAKEGGTDIAKAVIPKWMKIGGVVTGGIWLVNGIAATIEPGIYKPEQTNAVYRKLGIPFQYPVQEPAPKPGPFSSSSSLTFNEYYNSLVAAGVKGINNEFAQQTQIFTKQNLIDLVNAVYGDMVFKGKAPSVKELTPEVSKYLIGEGKNVTISQTTTNSTNSSNNVRVFIGIVSQGVLGKGLDFTARQDDLIENMQELQDAAQNNVAPFLASLASRARYEIKVVSSIVTKDGFRQTGQTRQIQIGTYKSGAPKYKTMTNKFAVMDIFIINDKGSRINLSRIVLGPTDAAKFTPGANEINLLQEMLPKVVSTTDVNNIDTIVTQTKTSVQIQSDNQSYKTIPATPRNNTGEYRFYKTEINNEIYIETIRWAGNVPFEYYPITSNEFVQIQTQQMQTDPARWAKYFVRMARDLPTVFEQLPEEFNKVLDSLKVAESASGSGTTPSVTNGGGTGIKSGTNALTLSEWYQVQGQSLPSLTARAELYQQLGLGQKEYYTGTAEQNTKLLNALKMQ